MPLAPAAIRWLFVVLMAWVVLALGRNLFFAGAEVGLLFGRFAHDLVLAGA